MEFDVSQILGVKVACLGRGAMLTRVIRWTGAGQDRSVYYVNAHCMNLAQQDQEYREILAGADLVYADGISIVWAGRMLGGCRLEKMTGADWIWDYCALAEESAIRTYILAGEPGVAQAAAAKLIGLYPGIQIAGAADGFFIEKDEREVLDEINSSRAEVLLVGMGVPLQEKWIARHRDRIDARVCWGVGALFDYVAGVEPRTPGWMYSAGLEWLWRLMFDPANKWRRYLLGNPAFVLRVLQERFRR